MGGCRLRRSGRTCVPPLLCAGYQLAYCRDAWAIADPPEVHHATDVVDELIPFTALTRDVEIESGLLGHLSLSENGHWNE